MLLSRNNQSDSRKAIIVAAVLAAGVVSALYVAQSDYDGSRSQLAAELSRKVAEQHKSVCGRLGQGETTQEHQSCMGELMKLQRWHEDLTAAQNESML
jgi:hypothetical protein